MNDIKTSILGVLASTRGDGMMLKKLKKECIGDDMTSLKEHTAAKQRFKRYYDELIRAEKILEDIKGLVTLNSGDHYTQVVEDNKSPHGSTADVIREVMAGAQDKGKDVFKDKDREKKEKKERKEKRAVERERSASFIENQSVAEAAQEVGEYTLKESTNYEEDANENPPSKKAKRDKQGSSSSSSSSGSGKRETGKDLSATTTNPKTPLVIGNIVGDRYDLSTNGEQAWREGTLPQEYLAANPDHITRLFCGNLKLDVTEEALKELIPGITYIRWQKDKVTKLFYGSTFLEMKDSRAAAKAVSLDGNKFMGRPLKIYYCPPKAGVIWPPLAGTAGNSAYRDAQGGGNGRSGDIKRDANGLDPAQVGRGYSQRAKTTRPQGCKKLYAGNLAYSIDDDVMVEFFKSCGEMVGLRWLTHKDSGEFRGCGFIEFSTSAEAEAAMLLDGEELLGRPIRLDWTN